jgi:hypothetical protein
MPLPSLSRINRSQLLFALSIVLLGWLLARELVLTTIAEHNRAQLQSLQMAKPWFKWELEKPRQTVGPYRHQWLAAGSDGIRSKTEQPVLSLPFNGKTLNTRLFNQLQMDYSAPANWLMRLHFSDADSSYQYVSQPVPLAAGTNVSATIDLNKLGWIRYKTDGAGHTERKPTEWGGPSGQVKSLLLYFWPDPAREMQQNPTISIRRIALPWNLPLNPALPSGPARQQASLIISRFAQGCDGPLSATKETGVDPFSKGKQPAPNELIIWQLKENCWLPEHLIHIDRTLRNKGNALLLPASGVLNSSSQVLVTSGLFILAFMAGLMVVCRHVRSTHNTPANRKAFVILLALLPLLVGNYLLPSLEDWVSPAVARFAAMLGLALLVPIVGWAIRNDLRRFQASPRPAIKATAWISASSVLLATGLLTYSGSYSKNGGDFISYFLWAIVQQSIIGPVLAETLYKHCQLSLISAALFAGAVFSLLHFPNPSLMLATAVAGSIWAGLWLRYRLLLPLAFSHALLALAFFQLSHFGWLVSGRVGMDFLGF